MIIPDWSAPENIGALQTTRIGGVSDAPFDGFNLGYHVGDKQADVQANHDYLKTQLPSTAFWLEQVHGGKVVCLEHAQSQHSLNQRPQADGIYTRLTGQPIAIMTADCLPILLTSSSGDEIAALHGGWRPLAQNIIAQALANFSASPEDILVWLGPAIGPSKFEVGQDVVDAFVTQNQAHKADFSLKGNQKYLADIYSIAKRQLNQLEVTRIYGGEHCTVSGPERFFSYRRDGETGRMATLIWRK